MPRIVAIAVPLLLAGMAGAQTPGFWTVGNPPNGEGTNVLALAQNGAVAAGYSNLPGAHYPGFTWTIAGGRQDFTGPGAPANSAVNGVSSDAAIVVGDMGQVAPASVPYRRVGTGAFQSLGLLPNAVMGYARGVSGDGAIVVGACEYTFNPSGVLGQAFRWTDSGGMQGLGYLRPNGTLSQANAISRDGSTIVGISQSDGSVGDIEAFLWRNGQMQDLPGLPGAPFVSAEAEAVNLNGSVAVGHGPSPTSQGHNHAIRWVNGAPQDLGVLPGFLRSAAYAVDDTGTVVGGVSYTGNFVASVWTPSTGMARLTDYLASFGVSTPAGFQAFYVYAVSGDGLTFGGLGRWTATGLHEGFVATIPAPMTALVLLPPLLRSRRGRA